MNVLVDTCVFLDIFLNRLNYIEDSKNLMKLLHEKKDIIFISPTTLKDIYYFVKKMTHDNDSALDCVSRIYNFISTIIDITADDTITAIFNEGDFEDNLIINASKRSMIDCIITRNINDFENKGIPVFTPKEFLNIYI